MKLHGHRARGLRWIGVAMLGLGMSAACGDDENAALRIARGDARRPAPAPVGEFCNAERGRSCAPGLLCVDDPADPCESSKIVSLCAGVCVEPRFCGGDQDIPCGVDEVCVDDPEDACDRARLGRRCDGVCAPARCDEHAGPHCRRGTLVGPIKVPPAVR